MSKQPQPNSIIVETQEVNADLKALTDSLTDERSLPDESKAAPSGKPSGDEDWMPAKWRGKTDQERAEMYRNLESAYGRQANDLGTQRKLTDQFLLDKRARDLGIDPERAPERKPREVRVTAAELLAEPGAVFARELDSLEQNVEQLVNRKLSEAGAQTQAQKFYEKHADAEQVTASAEFQAFLEESPVRSRAAALVRNTGDVETADALLTEFKARSARSQSRESEPEDEGVKRARAASLEGSGGNGGNNSPSKKIYRRADLIALKMRDPERYAELNDEIVRAYAEKRVK